MAPAGWHPIQPTGLAANIFGVALVFSILCTIVLFLRVVARVKLGQFAVEDGMMCVGWLINMVHNGVLMYGAHTGLGTPDDEIPGGATGVIYMEAAKTVFLWQCFFLSGYVWIKCSICVTLLRIALHKVHRTILWVLIIISVVSTVFVQLYVVLQCRPIAASWGEEAGVCASKTITVTITFVISAFNLVTDVITAVLPFIIIKDIQMTRRKKQAVIAVLSLGVLASIATIARLPYATAYFATTDVMVGLGDIVLWTIVECDLALIAGSLPMIRTLFKFLKGHVATSKGTGHKSNSTELHAMGLDSGRKNYVRQTDSRETALTDTTKGETHQVIVTQAFTVTTEGRSPERDPHMESEYQYQAKSYV